MARTRPQEAASLEIAILRCLIKKRMLKYIERIPESCLNKVL